MVSNRNCVRSYGQNHIVVVSNNNSELLQLTSNLILSPYQIVFDQLSGSYENFTDSDWSIFKRLEPELLIFETRPLNNLLSPKLLLALSSNNIGVEYMPLGAACRTYNLLVTEGRSILLVMRFL